MLTNIGGGVTASAAAHHNRTHHRNVAAHEGTAMEILSPTAVRIGAGLDRRTLRADAEVAKLQTQVDSLQVQVARLQAERATLWWAVGHDELTGLPNRRLFTTVAPQLLGAEGRPAVVIVLDLNGFKPINDNFGHDTGDDVLRIVARRLAAYTGDSLVARLGGDEFAAVLTSPHPETHGQWWHPTVATLATVLAAPMLVAGQTLIVTASIGVAPVHQPALIGELLHRADLAMYQAKATGQSAAVGIGEPVHGDTTTCPPRHQPTLRRCDLRREALIARRPDRDAVAVGGWPNADPGSLPGPGFLEHFVLQAAAQQWGGRLPAPTFDPNRRDPAEVAPAGTYHRDDPVWVHRDGAWRTGVVDGASAYAVMATYRCTGHCGTGVDTMTAQYVVPRADNDPDPGLDRRERANGASQRPPGSAPAADP